MEINDIFLAYIEPGKDFNASNIFQKCHMVLNRQLHQLTSLIEKHNILLEHYALLWDF